MIATDIRAEWDIVRNDLLEVRVKVVNIFREFRAQAPTADDAEGRIERGHMRFGGREKFPFARQSMWRARVDIDYTKYAIYRFKTPYSAA